MTARDHTNDRLPTRERTLEQFGNDIASPDVHVGGGAAASVAASFAAATAELVVSLIVGRKRSDPGQGAEQALASLRSLRGELLDAAYEDERALVPLMEAYRTKSDSLPELLASATRTSLRIARLSSEVVTIAADQVLNASRFTASDLGAAAAMAHGSVVAALLTARININLLDRQLGGDDRAPVEMRADAANIEELATAAYHRAVQLTIERVDPEREGSA